MFRKLILLFLFPLFSIGLCFGQDDCVLKKSDESILVYTCRSPDEKLKFIQASLKVRTSPAELAAYLMDVPNYIHWQYKTIEAGVLKRISDHELIYRSEIEAPWPVSNRELVMQLKITQDSLTQVMTVTLKSMADFIPEQEGVVRIPRASGQWVITPLGINEVSIKHTFMVDPGGYVPVWLINMALADGPFETFRNLKTLIITNHKTQPGPVFKK